MYKPDEVLKKYSRAIHKVANTYYISNPRFSYQDLVSEAKVAAIEACGSYREDNKGKASFFTFLTSAMNWEVQKFVKNNKYDLKVTEHRQREDYKNTGNNDKLDKEAKAFSIDQLSPNKNHDSSRESSLHSIIGSGTLPPDIAMIRVESIQVVMEELETLPDREKAVVKDRWLEGKTLEEIALTFGATKQTIHGWGKRGFDSLQKKVKARLGEELVF